MNTYNIRFRTSSGRNYFLTIRVDNSIDEVIDNISKKIISSDWITTDGDKEWLRTDHIQSFAVKDVSTEIQSRGYTK